MDIDLRKTAADAAYIAVGAGVLGFQQAQVRRREAGERLATLARDAQDRIGTQTATIRARVNDTASTGVDGATSTLRTIDPRQWAEPVVSDVRGRIEPVVEQLKTLPVPTAQDVSDQLAKAVEVGRARVQQLRGESTVN